MFTGLSAFPLTPFKNERVDFAAFEKLVTNLVGARVESICAMGSTGLYPYLSQEDFANVAKKTVELANGLPVMVGIGALRTVDVIKNAEAAQKAGVSAVLLAPQTYHPLHEHEVLSLYEDVTAELSVPLCVYENPGVTQFTFSDELYHKVSRLHGVKAIKIPGVPFATENGALRLEQLRRIVPDSVAIGVSGDKFGSRGMLAGCDLWFSVVAGLFPRTLQRLMQAAQSGQSAAAITSSEQLDGLWEQFARNRGGLRVMATAAEILGYVEGNCLPAPLKPLGKEDRTTLVNLLKQLQLD
ncbi:dihydrodipicolinate synthase family protein [Lacimicrobium sp. SS2-24]|uniref:dihydrodipicolinate synthase family protein n=1 Tax=Lacimicrobium sp. SS2-24 TaxID=2005569 RepID=UPI000B4C0115|nr:dihydrodipicolinate synthase family protein [Lacimicrobium sp. SS2-24]